MSPRILLGAEASTSAPHESASPRTLDTEKGAKISGPGNIKIAGLKGRRICGPVFFDKLTLEEMILILNWSGGWEWVDGIESMASDFGYGGRCQNHRVQQHQNSWA